MGSRVPLTLLAMLGERGMPTSHHNFIVRMYPYVHDSWSAQRRMKTPWHIDACNEYLVNNCPNSDYNDREEVSQKICQIIERHHIRYMTGHEA